MSRRLARRRFLATAAAGSLFAGAGCTTGRSQAGPDGTSEPPSTTTDPSATPTETVDDATNTVTTTPPDSPSTDVPPEPTAAPTPDPTPRRHKTQYTVNIDHPAAMELGKEPTIGKPPNQTEALVIQFTDISCTHCARFDAQTFPILYANYIRPGRMTFVSRDFPHVAEWTYPATYALDATYARDKTAYWELKSWYYARMHDFTMDNVYRRTADFLGQHTSVNPRPVVREMKSEAWKPAAQRDLQAKDAAGVQVTPTFFLFRNGRFVTKLRGNQNVQVFKSALGL